LLQFVLPGLKDTEKKLLFPAIAIGTGLFVGGCLFAYWMVLPRALVFFAEFAGTMGAKQMWEIGAYVTFTTRFILVFGIAFELPVIVMALVKLDILTFKIMKNTWRHALVAITLFAAVITPTPDVLTLMLMSGPLYVLYAICVILAYFLEKKDREALPRVLRPDRQGREGTREAPGERTSGTTKTTTHGSPRTIRTRTSTTNTKSRVPRPRLPLWKKPPTPSP